MRPNKRIFNNAQISDHFAIIPTTHEAKHLDEAEAKIFDMIARRFVAVFFPAAEFDVTTRISPSRQAQFQDRGQGPHRARLARGLRQRTPMTIRPIKALPRLTADDNKPAKTLAANLHAEATKPPPRYTEATLLSAMERRASSSTTRISPKP